MSGKMNVLYKTKMCTYHLAGNCCHKDACLHARKEQSIFRPRNGTNAYGFADSAEELLPLPDFRKTKPCRLFQKGLCRDSECKRAHGDHELRRIVQFYKKKICKYWREQGTCIRGKDCFFAHSEEDINPREQQSHQQRLQQSQRSQQQTVDPQQIVNNLSDTRFSGQIPFLPRSDRFSTSSSRLPTTFQTSFSPTRASGKAQQNYQVLCPFSRPPAIPAAKPISGMLNDPVAGIDSLPHGPSQPTTVRNDSQPFSDAQTLRNKNSAQLRAVTPETDDEQGNLVNALLGLMQHENAALGNNEENNGSRSNNNDNSEDEAGSSGRSSTGCLENKPLNSKSLADRYVEKTTGTPAYFSSSSTSSGSAMTPSSTESLSPANSFINEVSNGALKQFPACPGSSRRTSEQALPLPLLEPTTAANVHSSNEALASALEDLRTLLQQPVGPSTVTPFTLPQRSGQTETQGPFNFSASCNAIDGYPASKEVSMPQTGKVTVASLLPGLLPAVGTTVAPAIVPNVAPNVASVSGGSSSPGVLMALATAHALQSASANNGQATDSSLLLLAAAAVASIGGNNAAASNANHHINNKNAMPPQLCQQLCAFPPTQPTTGLPMTRHSVEASAYLKPKATSASLLQKLANGDVTPHQMEQIKMILEQPVTAPRTQMGTEFAQMGSLPGSLEQLTARNPGLASFQDFSTKLDFEEEALCPVAAQKLIQMLNLAGVQQI